MAVDDRDPQDQLDLLLEGVEGLARDGAHRQHCSETGRDRGGSTQRSCCRNSAPCGTDELLGKLVIGEVRVPGANHLDMSPDRRLAGADRLRQAPQHELDLGRQPIEVHADRRLPARTQLGASRCLVATLSQ